MMNKIWVVQEGKNDYSPAEEYGEVNFVTKADLRPINGSQNEQVEHDIKKFLASYVPMADFILPSGNPMVVVLLVMSLPFGHHRFLKWDKRRGIYIPHIIGGV